MPFSFHLVPTIGDLFIIMSGLCHMGVCAQGVTVKLVILLSCSDDCVFETVVMFYAIAKEG